MRLTHSQMYHLVREVPVHFLMGSLIPRLRIRRDGLNSLKVFLWLMVHLKR